MMRARSTTQQRHFARIMAEGGCMPDDIAITLDIRRPDVVAAADDWAQGTHAQREMAKMIKRLEAA